MVKQNLAFRFLLKTLVILPMVSWSALGSTTVILNKAIAGGEGEPAESNFDGYFSFEKEGFKFYDGNTSTYKQTGANQKEEILMPLCPCCYRTHTFCPEIENSGGNVLEIELFNCRNFFFHPSTREVSDEYHFITSPQVLYWGEEQAEIKPTWRGEVEYIYEFENGRHGINNDPNNEEIYGPYDIVFEVGLNPWIANAISVTSFGVGTTLTVFGTLTIFEPISSAIMGIGASACFTIAGLAASNYKMIEAEVETEQIAVSYMEYPIMRTGVKATRCFREVVAYPDEEHNGLADGGQEIKGITYFKEYQYVVEIEAVPFKTGN